jgi:adenylate kinase family enzyme
MSAYKARSAGERPAAPTPSVCALPYTDVARACIIGAAGIAPESEPRGAAGTTPAALHGGAMLANRILILGPCGAGKSTLARVIGERLGLPVVHLDRFFWNPGWVQTEHSTFRDRVTEAAGGGAWVMDGNYTDSLDVRLPRADAVIWLDFPRRIYFPRVLWRMIKGYGRAREDLGPGCPERIDLPFMRWVWTYPTRRPEHEEIVANLPAGVRGIILRSPAEVANFADDLPNALTVAPNA